jgi:uncharacterized protein YkwD
LLSLSGATRGVDASELRVDISAANLLAVEYSLIELTNSDRVKNGVAPLDFDPGLLWIARARATEQLKLESLSHYDNDGLLAFVKLLDRAGVRYALAGENLARSAAQTPDLTERIEAALMKSPTHRKNILERSFSSIAIGAAVDTTTGRIAFAQIFRGE